MRLKLIKRIAVSAVAACMVLAVLSCGEKTADNGAADMPVLKWYLPGTEQADADAVGEKINEILSEKIGCKLDIEYVDDSVYREKIAMLTDNGDTFDLCFVGYLNPYANMIERGGLMPINEYLDNAPELIGILPDYALSAIDFGGKIYAFPNMQIFASCTGLYIREDLFSEYGKLDINSIEKVQDLEPFFEWVKTAHPEVYPFKTGYGSGLGKEYGYGVEEEICTGVFVTNTDGVLKAENEFCLPNRLDEARLMREYYEKGYIRSDEAGASASANDSYAAWRGVYKPDGDVEYSNAAGKKIIGINLSRKGEINSKSIKNTMTGVGAKSRYPKLAVQIIELMNTDKELYNLVSFGIEGKHYKKVGENRIEQISGSGYDPGRTWRFANQFNAYILPGKSDDVWEQTKKLNDEAYISKLIGFSFKNDNVRDEIAQVEVVSKKYSSMYKGFLPLESYYDDFLKELEDAGIGRIIDEVNKQLEEK